MEFVEEYKILCFFQFPFSVSILNSLKWEKNWGPEPGLTQLVERAHHREVSLETEGDDHVDTGSHEGLGQGEGVGHQVGPEAGGGGRGEVGQGEGEEGGDEEECVHHGQDDH